MADVERTVLVGLDEGWEKVFACLLEGDGGQRATRTFDADVAGLCGLVDWLLGWVGGEVERLAVALERPDGPVAELLLARGVALFTINPKQVDRFRDRHSVGGAKDDYLDALVLADSLRTDGPLFRAVEPVPATVARLRALGRTRETLLAALNGWANRLRELWRQYYPQLLQLARSNLIDRFVWELFERYPTPAEAAGADPEWVASLVRRHRLRRVTAADVLAVLRSPAPTLVEGLAATLAAQAQLQLPMLRQAHEQVRRCERDLEAALEELSQQQSAAAGEDDPGDVAILRSLPGLGLLTCAGLLGEAWRLLQARDLKGLRKYSGVAPVTKASGRSKLVLMRRACNHHLRRTCDQWARAAVTHNPFASEHYGQLRARGHKAPRAYRGVADRPLTVIVAMLRDRTLYDPQQPRRASQLAA